MNKYIKDKIEWTLGVCVLFLIGSYFSNGTYPPSDAILSAVLFMIFYSVFEIIMKNVKK